MYLIIPSIELLNHQSRFKISGIEGTAEFYNRLSQFPEDLCKLFRLENVKSIQVTDTDSFVDYEDNNIDNICLMTEATFLPFQALTNCKQIDDCKKMLEYGVHRIVISDFAYFHPQSIVELIKEYSTRRIIFYIPVQSGFVYFDNAELKIEFNEYIKFLKSLGATRIVFMQHPDESQLIPPENYLNILKDNFSAWTYQYNAQQYSELEKLKQLIQYNMDSLIIGESFYSTKFSCQHIWRIAESKLDAPNDKIVAD